jgi:hypothetical protein
VFGVWVRRDLVPSEVTVIAAKLKESEAAGFAVDPAQEMLDDFAPLGDGAAEASFVDEPEPELARRERGETFLDRFV